ncbi:MAG: bacterial Ig-like domain-containing protein [Firmicutes bacterium]|nr:bacterial Ig-like domain-containing protein [Bacillota bacterium]
MKKRVISWLLTVVMVVSLLPTSVLADTLAADQEQQTQQEQITPVDTENTVPAEDEETQEQQEPAPETPAPQMTSSGGTALALAEGTVSSAKEFAEMDASGSYTLTKDIIVTEPYASDFSGTFDGNGHTVTLAIDQPSKDNIGLFSKISSTATIKNVTVDGTVTGSRCVGGIAGTSNGTITQCQNKATITATKNGSGNYSQAGGIVGYAENAIITSCANVGNVNAAPNDGRRCGGVAGYAKTSVIENCYNQGQVSSCSTGSSAAVGGIAGYIDSNASVMNCYNSGAISCAAPSQVAKLVGWNAGSTIKNCYYLGDKESEGANGYNYTDPTQPKTAEEMKSADFAALLGDGFMVKSGNYPALSWETPTAAVRFTIAPANATLEINGGTYTGSTTVALPAADTPYSYTVSCPGYTQQTGSVTVTDKDNPVANPANVTVTLAEDAAQWVTVTFTVTPAGAALTLKDGETQVAPTEGTTYQLLKGHAYTYTAETTEKGYEPAAGEVTPTESSTQTVALKKVQSIAVTKAPTKTEYYKGDAEIDLTGMVLTVNYDGTNETRTIEGDYAAAGVTCEGFSTEKPIESQTVTVKYRGKTAAFTIKVKDAMLFADFFTGLNGIATAQNSTSYKFESVLLDGGYVLKSTNEKKGNTTSSLTLTFAKAARLTFDCKTDSEKNYDGLRVDINDQTGSQFGSTGGYSGEKQDWKEFSIAVNAGDKVTVNYRKDSGGDKGQDCIWLRNFRAEVLPTVRFDVKDAAGTAIDATVTLKKGYTGLTAGTDGSYALTVGEKYTYTVEKKGYEKVTQEFTAQAGDNTITVTMVKLPVITLQFTPDDAAVTLKQGNTTVYKESADSEKGKNVYIAAKNTDYTYTVSKFGYETATGTIKVETGDVNKTVTLTEAAKYSVTFQITKPEGVSASPTVTVTYNGTKVYEGSGANCTLPAGDYTYTAKLDGCDTLSGSFVVKAAKTIGLEFVKSLTFDDFFAGLDGITAENGTRYGFEPVRAADGNYLESKKSYGTTTMKLTAGKPCVVSFQYFSKGYESSYSSYEFTVKNGSKTLLTAYDESEWKTFSTVLQKGDELTLSFSGSSYYNVKLKNFTVFPVYTISLNVTGAEDYTAVLQDSDGTAITGTDGKYVVPAGVYTYTVSKYGYQTETGRIIVTNKNVDQNVALTALTAYQVKFNVAPEGAAVTLTHPVGDTIAADENGAYIVYAGETYAYTVAKADYITVSGSFTAAKNDTIKVTLTYAGAGWDGTTKTAPKTENGVYQIGTAAELAWFADAVNGGQKAINGKLTANINLNGKTWTAIGTSSNKFAGTLDGDNYTVSGLVTTGLVGELAEGGVVENLRVNCAIVSTSSLLGGVANSSAGTIRNCMVSGSITFSSGGYNGASAIGGIAGRTTGNGVISGCVSRAVVKDAYDNSTYGTSAPLGGIAGYAYGVVENCYFTGTLAVKKTQPNKIINQKRGGLVGELNANAELKGSYVAGEFAIADESKFGAVVGKVNSGATITNCAYLDTVAPQAAADGTTSGMTAHTADYMRSAEFAVDMGMNQDDGTLNGGFPVLPWQGGTVLSADDLRAVSQAQQSLSLRGMTAADAAKKAKADWYAETVLGFYDLTDNNDKADLCKEYGIEAPGEAVTNLHDYFLTALQKHFYKELGLDAENADLLKADATGVYQIKGIEAVTVMLDDMESDEKVPRDCTTSLILPSTVQVTVNGAEKTVAIDWKSDNGLVTVKDDGTAAITAPAGGKATVTLKATLTSGSESKVKTFTLCLWSKAAEQQQTLDDIAAVITARNAAVRPLQGVGLYNDTTDANGKGVEKAFRRLLEEMGYKDVADKAVITYTDGSAKASGFDGAAHEYITANGDVKFFDGAVQLKEAYYAGLEFKVAYGGAEKTITTRAIVGRSFDDVQAQLTEAAKTLTWEMIRGENTNEAETNTTGAWDRHAVVGGITSNLTLPYSISGRYDMRVQWAVVDVAEDSNCLYISSDKDSASGVGNIVRPVRPAEGELPEDAGKETLIARVTYTDFDDDPYIKEHITGQNGVEVYADVFFDITVAPFDIDATNEMQTALTDNYQSLLVDFVDKTTKPDLRKVDADLQMPRPYLLQQEGIMTDSYNQKVTMVSLTPDVLGFNGYHAMVYRPLPGEEAAEARYVVTITTRSSGQLLARQEFSFTIQPFTKQELDDAAAFMRKALTGDVYWDGIKNKNTDKTNVTSDLYPFAEICKNEDGTLEYVRGTVNMTFDGIEADDIPGWLDTEKYRCFRSSRPSVIENELLRVHRPEYNTTVTLDSVLTYTKYAQYWEKFGLNGTEETKEKYKLFEQFYKQPVSVDLTVTGLTGKDDPNENAMITVTVQVDSYKENKHRFTGTNYTFTGKASNDWTAWDAVKACLDNAKYEYTGSGAYLKSITDTKGQTLGEKDDGKSSGWMFGVTPAQGEETLPNTTLDATFIHDGDTVRLFFTNKYIPVDPDEPVDPGTEVPNFDKVYADTKKYIQNNVPAPVVASDRGEWAVLGLARAGVELSDAYIQAYYGKVVAYVQKNMGADGVLVDPESHNPTVTDNERIILALTAIGKDPANVGGKNLLAALQNKDIMQVTNTSDTDINGLVFGLLALNSGNYTQDSYWLVQAILTQQNEDGSWSSSADTKPDGDVDMTAMALQALAPYYNEGGDTTVNAAVDKALQWLSAKYKGTGYTSAESCAQVVVALSALQLNANSDSSFVKTVDGAPTSVLGDLLRYYLGEGQGFKHAASGKTADQKATEQALYAMAAYERYCRRTKALYDMTDAVCAHSFGDWQVVSPATCTADGSRQRVCTRCGAVEVQTLPAAGHKFGEWTTTKEPTCTETGTEKRICTVCSKEETRVIAALGHTPGTEVSVDKNDHWNICEVCHEAVNKTEHTYVNGIQCVCGVRKGAEGDADTTIKRVVVSDEITFALEDNDKLNTPDKVKAELQLQITLKNSKSNKDNTVFMDVSLLVFENNEWRPAAKEDLTAGKITVLLPYPEAVAAKYGQYNFTVAHMVAMADCGLDVGTVEFPAVTKTASGLLVTLTGLSPVVISWTESTNHYYYNPATTPDKTDSANTADDSQMVLWLGSAALAAAAVVVLTRKKRVSK